MSVRLKPCPFCKGEAEFERMGTRRQSCIVACQWCGCRLESNEEGDRCGKQWNTRAALEEKPLSRKWREEADEIERAEGEPIAPEDGQVPETLRQCADELDASREEDRKFMQRLEERLKARYVGATEGIHSVLVEFADEIRNHLGVER